MPLFEEVLCETLYMVPRGRPGVAYILSSAFHRTKIKKEGGAALGEDIDAESLMP